MAGEGPGAAIGAYKLLEEIGEGGFGKVFMADQEAPIRRTVAVKILKPGMDSASIVARFESERQALALMNHPNIAQILDGGTTRAGRPYFVMELVRGLPITDFCDRNQLPLNDRLMLFVSVCRAIQHAHYKGIIHRDIKPTNIMVALHDGVPAAKVIDFGIAKALEQKATERTFTLVGQMIGTPAYMSPEQVEMSGLDIDTRTDVYALGVLFYELLTGTTPLDAANSCAASYADLQRMIREDEPPRPSTRLSSLGDTATIVAGQRGAKPKHLAGRLAGDLDWIALKALEKDRNRRYASAESFADDVERYFRGEMIAARPASPWYRLRKFARRNRAPVAAALALSIGLLGGAAIATWQAIVATKAKDDALNSAAAEKLANEAATKAKDDALNSAAAEKLASEAATKAKDDALNSAAAEKLANEAATQAKETAEQKSAESEAAIRFLTVRILAAARPKGLQGGLGPAPTLRDAIDASVPFIDKGFPKQPLVEARVRRMLGISYWHLGEHQKSIAQNELARVIFADKLGADDPEALGCLNDIAIGHALSGHFDAAVRINEEARENLGKEERGRTRRKRSAFAITSRCATWNSAATTTPFGFIARISNCKRKRSVCAPQHAANHGQPGECLRRGAPRRRRTRTPGEDASLAEATHRAAGLRHAHDGAQPWRQLPQGPALRRCPAPRRGNTRRPHQPPRTEPPRYHQQFVERGPRLD